jgi:hypothetical protein
MKRKWNQAAVQQYIIDGIEESLTLEYKGAGALGRSHEKKKEIRKDVSAMANSAGGIIIYGVAECQVPSKKHLPEKIDPVDRTDFSREWLEQVINNIRPRIEGLVITPVPIEPNATVDTVYIVEIPQSTTAHQATDGRYYKRYNFQSIPMEDHEIRDVMGRQKHPKIELGFRVQVSTQDYTSGVTGGKVTTRTEYELKITARNVGQVYARYVNAFTLIPYAISYQDRYSPKEPIEEDGELYCEYYKDNTRRDVVDVEGTVYLTKKYGPSWFDPLLPGLSRTWSIRITDGFAGKETDGLSVKWSVYSDNAPPNAGEVAVEDIEVVDLRES